ncbi:MAG: ribosome biogenesis GTPase Der [Longimicrobiales bacterium]
MSAPLPTVAIIGRPNVGKSTLFNRILGEPRAIVEDEPGVTRDRNIARADWAGHGFYLVDTGGLDTGSDTPLGRAVQRQVLTAIDEADVLVLVVDGRTGPHPLDQRIAELVRRADRPVLLVVNKLDRLPSELGQHDFWALGIGEPLPLSAISGKGSGDVLDAIVARFPSAPAVAEGEDAVEVAVIGKPNVGKSSFINRLLGEERLVVGDEAGTTRDAIDTPLTYHARRLVFVDTAGLRRQSRIGRGLEFYSVLRTQRSVERADVCVLLVDATEPVHAQDLKIASRAWDAGAGLIMVANKWDLVEKETMTSARFEKSLHERAPFLKWTPIIFTSALTGQRVHATLDLILEVDAARHTRIATNEVTEAVRELAERQPPPHVQGRQVKFYYATQASEAPPSFIVFTNHPQGVTETYTRYLHNGFRARWGFTGSPIRFRFRGRSGAEA